MQTADVLKLNDQELPVVMDLLGLRADSPAADSPAADNPADAARARSCAILPMRVVALTREFLPAAALFQARRTDRRPPRLPRPSGRHGRRRRCVHGGVGAGIARRPSAAADQYICESPGRLRLLAKRRDADDSRVVEGDEVKNLEKTVLIGILSDTHDKADAMKAGR